jgi:hypothetical protein
LRYAILISLLTLSALAQPKPPQPQQGPQQGPPPQAVLHDILQLDDTQMKALGDLGEQQRAAGEAIAAKLGPAQQALDAALNATTPDATAVGKALLAVRDLQRQMESAHKIFADGFLALLNDAQKQQVQQIRNIEAALHAAEALHAIGL